MRIVYAINWLNIGAIFYAMEPDLRTGVLGLGSLTSSFYIGLGLLQVPGGVMAAKWGPKKVVVLGTLLSSASAAGVGIAPSLEIIALLRFLVGSGMALVFAPAVVMISRMLRTSNSGTGVGIFNSAFNVGGILALFLWGILAGFTGWRPSVELSGVLGLGCAFLVATAVPPDGARSEFRVKADQLKRVIGDSRLVIIGIGMLGVGVGNLLVSNFLEYYVERVFGLDPASAGIIASMVVVVPIFSALYAGRTYDRLRRPRLLLVVSNLMMALSLVLSAFPSWSAALASSLLGGFTSGVGLTVGFAAAKDLHRAEEEYDGLAVAWVNCISLFGAFFAPVVFSYVAHASGYFGAWLVGAGMVLALTLPLGLLMEEDATEGWRRSGHSS